MRSLLAVSIIFLGLAAADAQEQEKKLLDRLLKPDASLQNSAGKKQFVAGETTITKKARTKFFFFTARKGEKEFWNTRQVSARKFPTESSRFAQSKADLTTRSSLVKVDAPYATNDFPVNEEVDARKVAQTSAYPGNREFTGRGKSQKALSAQDRPLTLEQVRELLNKNK